MTLFPFTGDPSWAPQPTQNIISHDFPSRRSITIIWFRPPFQWSRIVVQSLSFIQFFANPWTAAGQAYLSFTISQSLQKLMSIELVMPSNHLIVCQSRLLLPSIFLSIRVFSNESGLCIRWPKYWSFSFSISPSNEYWMNIQDWFPLGLTGWIFLLSKRLWRVLFNTTAQSISSSVLSLLYGPTLTSVHDYWKKHSFGHFSAK